jgi:phosphocarrier protein FPr
MTIQPFQDCAVPAAQLVGGAGLSTGAALNLTRRAGPFQANSINGVLGLGARQGDRLRIRAADPAALAQLAAFIETGCGDEPRPSSPLAETPLQAAEGQLAGIPASEGIAVGPLVRLRIAAAPATPHPVGDEKAEWERLAAAIRGALEETHALAAWSGKNAGLAEAGIFEAQALFLEDPALVTAVSRRVLTERVNAEYAWQMETSRSPHDSRTG